MNKFVALLVVALAIESSIAANITASTTGNAACSSSTGNFANCNTCDSTGSSYCTSCKPGYQLSNVAGSSAPTYCSVACTGNCLYCESQTASATAANYSASSANTGTCQIDNNPAPSDATYLTAVCANTSTSGVFTAWATPGTVADDYYPCYSCISNCINCRPASGTAPSSAPTTCQQCEDGYYLDSNQTADTTTKIVAGTTCTACSSIASITSATTSSAFTVTGECNKCVNKNVCINATCTKAGVTASGTSGTITSDTTSYVFDVATQTCKAKSAARLAVAVFGAVAVAFVALF